MESQTLEAPVEALEHIVNGENGVLARLDRLSGEVSEIRREMRDGFSAVRDEFAVVRGDVAAGHEETRRYMGVLYEEAIARIAASHG